MFGYIPLGELIEKPKMAKWLRLMYARNASCMSIVAMNIQDDYKDNALFQLIEEGATEFLCMKPDYKVSKDYKDIRDFHSQFIKEEGEKHSDLMRYFTNLDWWEDDVCSGTKEDCKRFKGTLHCRHEWQPLGKYSKKDLIIDRRRRRAEKS